MPQAAVRIAPSPPVAASAHSGGEARAVAEAGLRLPRGGPRHASQRPGRRTGAAPDSAEPVPAAADAPRPRELVPCLPVDPRFRGGPFLENQLPKIDATGRGGAPGVDGDAAAIAALRGSA